MTDEQAWAVAFERIATTIVDIKLKLYMKQEFFEIRKIMRLIDATTKGKRKKALEKMLKGSEFLVDIARSIEF